MTRVLLTGGSVFDGQRALGPASVLLEGGRVAAVGEVPPDRADGAEVVDVAGGLVAPGFVDAHVHPIQGGLERLRCDLTEGETREEYLATIAQYAADHPELPWILGGGWAMPAFPGAHPWPRTWTRSCRTVRSTSPTATTTGPGSTPGRWSSP
jgi:predicted amidohydrolase YtcJ